MLKSFLSRSFFVPFLVLLSVEYGYAQEIEGPENIMVDFRNELDRGKLQNEDTLLIYSQYLKQLVDRGNYLHADTMFVQVASGFEQIQDSARLVNIYLSRAYMYKVQRRFARSLEDYLWLKSYYEGKKDDQNLIKIYSQLAEYYRAIGLYDLCDSHLKQAESLFSTTPPNTENLAFWYSRKAAWSNESLKNQDSVVFYAQEGLKLAEQTDNIQIQALLLNEIGYSNMARNQPVEIILEYFNQAINLLLEHERYRDYTEVMNNLARYYFMNEKYDISLVYLDKIIPIEEVNHWYEPLQTSLEMATGIYRVRGNEEKLDTYSHQLYEARLQNQGTFYSILTNDQALAYEKDISEKELQVQEQKTAVAEAAAKSNQRAFIIALSIAVALLIIVLVSFQINRRFRRKNELLSKQREQIQKTNSELERSLDQQRILFKELNHRVKNNLSILTGLIYLQEVGESDDDFKKTLGTLRNRIKSMALAHESLYNSEEAENIEFQGYLRELFLELRAALSDANKIETRIECQGFELGLQQAVPLAMIINELFTNSVKHGFEGMSEGKIVVKARHEGETSIIEYTDNGKGFSVDQKEKGTLGLRLVKLLLEQLDASFSDQSGHQGVHFVFTIPLLEKSSV